MQMTRPLVLTADDYRELPETGPRYQLVEGELHMAPAPNRYHQDVVRNLTSILLRFLDEHPLGVIYLAPFDVRLSELNVFQPDIIFVSNRNASILTEQGAEGAPDLVIEVLSPSTAHLDKKSKRQVYARARVRELWIVDPHAKEVEVFALSENEEQPLAVHRVPSAITTVLLPGLKIDLAKVFQRPRLS